MVSFRPLARLFLYLAIFLVYLYLAAFLYNHYRNSLEEHGVECHEGNCYYGALSKRTIPNESVYAVILMGLILSIPFCGIYWCIMSDSESISSAEKQMVYISRNESADSDVSSVPVPIQENRPKCVECWVNIPIDNKASNGNEGKPETIVKNKTQNGGKYWQNLRLAINRMMLGRKMMDGENLIPVSDRIQPQINGTQGQQ